MEDHQRPALRCRKTDSYKQQQEPASSSSSQGRSCRKQGELIGLKGSIPRTTIAPGVETKIGRLDGNDVVLDNPFVSSYHCVVRVTTDGKIFIKDTSTNGTFLKTVKNRLPQQQWTEIAETTEVVLVPKAKKTRKRLASFMVQVNEIDDDDEEEPANVNATLPFSPSSSTTASAERMDTTADKADAIHWRRHRAGTAPDTNDGDSESDHNDDDDDDDDDDGDGELLRKKPRRMPEGSGEASTSRKSKDSKATEATGTEGTKDEESDEEEDKMAEHLQCSICCDLIHDAVSLIPCLHTFCGGCCSQWISTNKTCPECRVSVTTMQKAHMVNSLIETYLAANPAKKRDDDELKRLDADNLLKQQGKTSISLTGAAPASSPSSSSSSSTSTSPAFVAVSTIHGGPMRYAVGFGALMAGPRAAGRVFATPRIRCRACSDPAATIDNTQCPAINPPHLYCACCRSPFPGRDARPATLADTADDADDDYNSDEDADFDADAAADDSDSDSDHENDDDGDDGASRDAGHSRDSGDNDSDDDDDSDRDSSDERREVIDRGDHPTTPRIAPAPVSATPATAATPSGPAHRCVKCNAAFCCNIWTRGCSGPCRVSGGKCLTKLGDLTIMPNDTNTYIQRNAYESTIMNEYLSGKGQSHQDFFRECLEKVDRGTLSTAMIPPAATSDSHYCRPCALKVFSDLSLLARRAIATDDLPSSARTKPDGTPRTACWYGRECRTQFNRPHHAVNFDHIAARTR